MSEIIVADHVLTNDAGGTLLEPGAIEVDPGGRILSTTRVLNRRPSGPKVTDLGDEVLMPGLVNAHAHTPMSLMRGVAEGHSLLSMEGFLAVLRSREAHLTPDLVPASVAVSCADMIRHGTTAFADQYFFADEIIPTVTRSGLRARVAWGIVELGDDAARARELASTEAFVRASAGNDLVQGWVGPHAYFVDNQPAAMEAERALAKHYETGLHVHFSTSREEDEYCLERWNKSAIEMLLEMQMFDVPTILAHCNTLPEEQLPLLEGTRAALALIPSVAMMSGAAAAPARAALDAGITIALGTDNVCNNTNSDLFEEMRTLGKLASFTSRVPNQITPREILGIATTGGHRALNGGANDGTLSEGAVADLIAIPVRDIARGPVGAQSLEAALVYCTSGASVAHSMVNGRWLMREATILTLDVAEARKQQQLDYDTLVSRMLIEEF